MQVNFYLKFYTGEIADVSNINFDDALNLVKVAKNGHLSGKDFEMHVGRTGETVTVNHKDIKSVEIEFPE